MIDENPSNPPTGNDGGSTATSPEGPRDRIVDLEIVGRECTDETDHAFETTIFLQKIP